MRSSLLLLVVALATAHADDGMNEVILYDGQPPTRYKPARGEAMLDGPIQATAWMPSVNTKAYSDTVDVVVAHADQKVFLVFAPDQGKRATLPISLALADVDVAATTFDEKPKHELLVWVHGNRDAASEAYLLAWDRTKHQPIVDKHWTGLITDHTPAWAIP